MKTAVFYYSRSNNTKRLAEAVAEELGVESRPVSQALSENAEKLFLGCSVYKATYDPAVETFLKANADKIGELFVFGSAASGRSVYKKLSKLCDELKIKLSDKYFSCPGSFLFMNKGRPNESDLAGAKQFAKEAMN